MGVSINRTSRTCFLPFHPSPLSDMHTSTAVFSMQILSESLNFHFFSRDRIEYAYPVLYFRFSVLCDIGLDYRFNIPTLNCRNNRTCSVIIYFSTSSLPFLPLLSPSILTLLRTTAAVLLAAVHRKPRCCSIFKCFCPRDGSECGPEGDSLTYAGCMCMCVFSH